MKLDFAWKDDGQVHTYCIVCHGEHMESREADGRVRFYCYDCDKNYERWIKVDPGIKWWLADDGEVWHESSGIFVRNPEGKFLFFERIIFPYAVTVPAGHVDAGEEPAATAARELEEEVGLHGTPVLVAEAPIPGDVCSRGADIHQWHAFLVVLDETPAVEVREEGNKPVWLSLDEALRTDLTVPVRYFIENHRQALDRQT